MEILIYAKNWRCLKMVKIKINIKSTYSLILYHPKRQLSKYKITAMYYGFIAYMKVRYMTIIKDEGNMSGVNLQDSYMRKGIILFVYLSQTL